MWSILVLGRMNSYIPLYSKQVNIDIHTAGASLFVHRNAVPQKVIYLLVHVNHVNDHNT